jgi:uncharacterized protein (DUF1697 family)
MNLGRRRLPMSRLKALFEGIGLGDVATFIASGNVIFSGRAGEVPRLESKIAAHLEASLGYKVDTFVRTLEEVAVIADRRPFEDDPLSAATIHVGFFREPLAPETARKLSAVRTREDEFRVVGREYYWLCRIRVPDSKVWTLPEIRALKLPTSTMRNLSSLRKLVAKHPA